MASNVSLTSMTGFVLGVGAGALAGRAAESALLPTLGSGGSLAAYLVVTIVVAAALSAGTRAILD